MKKIYLLLIVFMYTFSFAQKATLVVPDGPGFVQDMAIDKAHKYLYTVNKSKAVMWEVATGRQLYTFRLDGEEVYGIAVSNDGKKVAVAAEFKNYCFSTVTGKLIFKDTKYGGISNGLIFSPDDKIIYVGHEGLWELDAETGASTNKIAGNNSGEGKHLFYIDNNTKLVVPGGESWEVYDIVNREKLYSQSTGGLNYITALPEQGYVIAGRNRDVVKVLDVATGKLVKQLAANSYDALVLPSQDSHQLIFCTDNIDAPQRLLYNTDDFTVQKKFTKKLYDVNNTFFFGKENIAFIKNESTLVQFNTKNETNIRVYEGISANFGSETFSSLEYNQNNGTLHVTTDQDNLKTIDLFRMKPIRHTSVNTGLDALAFSPSGDTIASFNDAPFSFSIKNITTGKTIKPVANIHMTQQDRNLYFFSPDGGKLFYPEASPKEERQSLIQYDMKTGVTSPLIKTRTLYNINVSADKDLLGANEQAEGVKSNWGIWNLTTGKKIFTYAPADESGFIYAGFSKDKNDVLALGGSKLYYFDIATGKLLSTSTELKRTVNGNDFTLSAGNFSVSAVSSDLSLFAISIGSDVSNASGEVFMYKRSGELLYTSKAHSSTIRSILFSPDDKILYTISHDQTIKMWDVATGNLIGTLYLFKDSNDYVFIDADGRFDGSPEGLQRLYFINNREVLPLDRLYEKYYQPNLYARLVNGEHFDPILDDIIKPAPKVKIAYAAAQRNLEVDNDVPSYQNTTGFADITVNASAEDDAVDEIRLFINGKIQTLTTRNLIVANDAGNTDTKKYQVNLLPGQNRIRAVALNTQRTESEPDEIAVDYNTTSNNQPDNGQPVVNKHNNTTVSEIDKNATLHLVVVGINAYKNPAMSLNYALADATAFKEEVEKDSKSILTNIKTYFVTDTEADKTGITNAIKQVQQAAKPQDLFIFYYAGHGVISDKEFYLVPNDVTDLKNVDEALKEHGIPAKDLQQYAINIQAQKQLFILDACQSAGAFATLMSDDGSQQKTIAVVARSTGTHWIAASGAQQFANEFSSLGHGAFTYVLLQALHGEAASNKMITVNDLKSFLQVQVPALMKKYNGAAQYPASYGFGNDFPVEVVK